MEKVRVVVANEPRAYREAIGTVMRELRPDVEVVTVEPGDLDDEVFRCPPLLVVCSRLTDAVLAYCKSWIALYPNGESHAEISIGGRFITLADVAFDALMSLLDEAVAFGKPRGDLSQQRPSSWPPR
ncbi:MAG: hypothetical protein M3R06_09790 [Chloroflexota bacterium]|nr:hypothetical protein [Chloroflexota bacterium]